MNDFSQLSQRADEIRARIEALDTELEQINERAEGRSLNQGEQARFDRQLRARENAQAELEQVNEEYRAALARYVRTSPGAIEHGDGASRSPEFMRRVDPLDDRFSVNDRARAILGDERRAGTEHLQAEQRANVERLLRTNTKDMNSNLLARRLLLTENDEYRNAFWRLTMQPNPVLRAEETEAVRRFQEFEAEQRAMSIGTDSAGGYGVPVLIDPTIILTSGGNPNDILNIARVETITNDEWRGISSAGVTWSFDAEAAEVSDDSPSLAAPSVATHKAQALIPYTVEAGMDYPNFAAEMSRLLSEGYSDLLAEKLTLGTGSGEPLGIVPALDATTTSEVVVTTDGAFSAIDVHKLWAELPIKYRRAASCAFMSSTDVMNEVRQFGNNGSGGSNFTVNMTQEAIPKLFGKNYYENDFMDDFTSSTSGAELMVVGAWENYLVAQRAGMNVELVPHLLHTGNNRPYGMRGLYAWARVGGGVVNAAGFRLLVNQ